MEVTHVGVFASWLECVKCCRCRCCDGCRRCYSLSHYTARLDMNGNGVHEAKSLSLPASTRPACLASVGVQFRSALSKISVYTFIIHIKCCKSTHTYIKTYICTFRPGRLTRLALRGPRLLASRSVANYNIQVAVWANDDGALLCTTTPPTRPHAPLLIYKLLGST